ncbi:MAG: amidohydrolase family protein [Ferruginibacter sp.]
MYRKFKADKIFTGEKFLEGENVLLTDNEGRIIDIVLEEDAGNDIESIDGILSPGFINCHCHLELSHLKEFIPKYSGLTDFVYKVVTERNFDEALILRSIAGAEDSMLKEGIVAVGDICNNTHTIPQKKNHRLYYHNFIEVAGFTESVSESRFKNAGEISEAFSKSLLVNSIVPHAPYSVSPTLLRKINSLPKNSILSIHNQEADDENIFFLKGDGDLVRMYEKMNIDISFFKPTGKTSLQSWLPQFTNGQSILLVHNVATQEQDLQFVKASTKHSSNNLSIYFCLCPNANLYISNKLPDVPLFVGNDCNIVLGTDSLASNSQLSIIEEINTLQQHFPELEMEMMLQWATMNGARALRIEKDFGSFEIGKKPGIIGIKKNENNKFRSERVL